MPIKLILINNNELGKISKEQRAAMLDVWATSLVNPDFAAYATGCGALGIKVTVQSELKDAMAKIMAHNGPALLEVASDVSLI
jgi:Thiamine pyrophosphate-requiring enzymes [acetolactate synthase, pyruvate dehydrogenase (cytochrome), glyoxylate carboligase, phosphonopyruvate decarboxylase]